MIPQKPLEYITSTGLMSRDYRTVQPGSVFFVCSKDMPEEEALFFLEQARLRGAIYSLVDFELYERIRDKIDKKFLLPVDDTTMCWSYLARLLYPSQLQNAVAVTGTSGKTTVSWFYSQFIAEFEGECLYVGTLGAFKIFSKCKKQKIATTLTTPDALDLSKILTNHTGYGCFEASSHGLDQNRLAHLRFTIGCFTNLSLDHLDYHLNMRRYFAAKKKLFNMTDKAVINCDTKYGKILIKDLVDKDIMTYGRSNHADLQLISAEPNKSISLKYKEKIYKFPSTLIGAFNYENFTAAIALLIMNGFTPEDAEIASHGLILPTGRLTKLAGRPEVYIDYAHKPDALRKVLIAFTEYRNYKKKGNIWLVFGCGGSRDMRKRAIMGSIAAKYADKIVVTDDNPRHEYPGDIRSAIISGIFAQAPHKNYYNIEDRQSAIEYAIASADSTDIIIIAGKGHENYQQIGDKKHRFSDIAAAKATLRRRRRGKVILNRIK
jgi:UDP-N-acetylmuramoyl-L-alanyl-D-glutamate--2,6-diaminopimelate ligase